MVMVNDKTNDDKQSTLSAGLSIAMVVCRCNTKHIA